MALLARALATLLVAIINAVRNIIARLRAGPDDDDDGDDFEDGDGGAQPSRDPDALDASRPRS